MASAPWKKDKTPSEKSQRKLYQLASAASDTDLTSLIQAWYPSVAPERPRSAAEIYQQKVAECAKAQRVAQQSCNEYCALQARLEAKQRVAVQDCRARFAAEAEVSKARIAMHADALRAQAVSTTLGESGVRGRLDELYAEIKALEQTLVPKSAPPGVAVAGVASPVGPPLAGQPAAVPETAPLGASQCPTQQLEPPVPPAGGGGAPAADVAGVSGAGDPLASGAGLGLPAAGGLSASML